VTLHRRIKPTSSYLTRATGCKHPRLSMYERTCEGSTGTFNIVLAEILVVLIKTCIIEESVDWRNLKSRFSLSVSLCVCVCLCLCVCVRACACVHVCVCFFFFCIHKNTAWWTDNSTLHRYYEYINLVCKKKPNVALIILLIIWNLSKFVISHQNPCLLHRL
jgi:hypothetical protein